MFEKLRKIVGDNKEALEILDSLETSTNSNVAKINELEKKFNEAKGGRDNLKNLLRNATGLDEVNEDTINEFVSSLKGAKSKDESLNKELENVKALLEKANSDRDTIVKDYETKLSDMALTNAIRDLGIGAKASTPMAEKILIDHLKNGAVLDGDKIIYKNADGTTMYNGTNLVTPQERFKTLMSDDDWKPFLKADVTSGSGARETSGASTTSNLGGSKDERTLAIKNKYNL